MKNNPLAPVQQNPYSLNKLNLFFRNSIYYHKSSKFRKEIMEAEIRNEVLRPNYMETDDVYLKIFLYGQDRFKRILK